MTAGTDAWRVLPRPSRTSGTHAIPGDVLELQRTWEKCHTNPPVNAQADSVHVNEAAERQASGYLTEAFPNAAAPTTQSTGGKLVQPEKQRRGGYRRNLLFRIKLRLHSSIKEQ